MKRLGLAFCFLAVFCVQALAGSLTLLGSGKPPSGGGGSITWTPGINTAWQNVTFGATSTFHPNNGVAFPANSLVCETFATRASIATISPITVTIDGSTPTLVVSDTGGSGAASGVMVMYCITKASFASDAVAISGANNFGWEVVLGGYFQNFASSFASAVGCGGFGNATSATQTIQATSCGGANATITNPANGIGIAFVYGRAGTAGTSCATPTWGTSAPSNITNAAGDLNACATTNPDWLSAAHTITAGSWGPSETSSPANASNSAMVAATFN